MTLRSRAWTALLLPPFAWFVFEQGLSALLHANCSQVVVGVGWGVLTLLACGYAVRLGRVPGGDHPGLANAWLAGLAKVVAGVFALATSFQTLAILLVPPCLR